MTNSLNWESVADREDIRPEFGACHVNYAWRRHRQHSHKFASLENAFLSSNNSIIKLLQDLGGNTNAANYSERGACLYAALWYPDRSWAILCSPTLATLVQRELLEGLEVTTQRDDNTIETLRTLFESSPSDLRRELDESFYSRNIA